MLSIPQGRALALAASVAASCCGVTSDASVRAAGFPLGEEPFAQSRALRQASSSLTAPRVPFGGWSGAFAGHADPFGGEEHYATDLPTGDPAVVDLDRDGWLDVVTPEAGALRIRRNDGAGRLEEGGRIEIGTGVSAVASADLNGDDRPDLVFTLDERDEVGVMLAGTSGFGDATFLAVADLPSDVEIADLNRDGRLDLAVASPLAVTTWLGDGAGGFGGRHDSPRVAGETVRSARLQLKDINRDGFADAALLPGTRAAVEIMSGDGAGGFGEPFDVPGTHLDPGAAVADLDADGWPDIALGQWCGTAILWNDRSGGLEFPERDTLLMGSFQSCDSTVLVADFDGDGLQDLISSSSDAGSVSLQWLRGVGGRGFAEAPGPLLSRFMHFGDDRDFVSLLAGADLDRDGALDLISLRRPPAWLGNSLSVLRHARPRYFRGLNRMPLSWTAGKPEGLRGTFHAARLGGGRVEMLQQAADRLVHWVFDPQGMPRVHGILEVPGVIARVVDLDGDGFSDLVMSRGADLAIVRLGAEGPGPEALWPDAILVAVGELEDPPGPDLLVSDAAGALSLLLNDGGGGFKRAPVDGVVLDQPQVYRDQLAGAGDVDGDGADEVVARLRGDRFGDIPDRIQSFANYGDGLFRVTPALDMAEYHEPAGMPIRITDLDGDGRREAVCVMGHSSGALDVLDLQSGETRLSLSAYEHPRGPIVADFDGNGRLDVAIVSSLESMEGHVTFVLHSPEGFVSDDRKVDIGGAQSILAGDVDGDGLTDLVVGMEQNFGPTRIAVMLNTSTGPAPTPVSVVGNEPGAVMLAIERVSPNPARGPATLRLAAPEAGTLQLELFDVAGRRVYGERHAIAAAGHHAVRLDPGRDLPAGLYLVRASIGGQAAVGRLAIVR